MSNHGWRNSGNGGNWRPKDSWQREEAWTSSNSYQKPNRETKIFVKKEESTGNVEQATQPPKEEKFQRYREETWVPKNNNQRPPRETKIFVKKEEKAENVEQKTQYDKEEGSKSIKEEQKEDSRSKNQPKRKKEVQGEGPFKPEKQEKKFVRKDESLPEKKNQESQPKKDSIQQSKKEKRIPKAPKNGNPEANRDDPKINEKTIENGSENKSHTSPNQLTEQEQKEINQQFLLDEERVAELGSLLFESAEILLPPVVDSKDEEPNQLTEQIQGESASEKEKEYLTVEDSRGKEQQKELPRLQKGKSGEGKQIKSFGWVSKKFNQIYSDRRLFKNLYKQLVETWEEIQGTTEDEDETFKFFLNTKPSYFLKYSIFVCLLFNLLIEKELFRSAILLFEKKESFIINEEQFKDLILDVVEELRKPKHKVLLTNSRQWKASTNFSNRVSLSHYRRKLDEVVVVDRFEKYNGSLLRVEAFEKIKREEKIAIHYEINKYIQSYSAVLQVATKNEVFLFDIERLCRFDDNMQALVSFLTFIIGKKSSTVIVMNAKEFCDNLMNTLFIENEKKNLSFVEKKTELCQILDQCQRNLTDMSVFEMGTSIEELVSKVLKQQLDSRQRFGDWYKRPLSEKQIVHSAIDVCSLLACYEELFEKKQSSV